MDEIERQVVSGIQLLERELIVRDFISVLNDGPIRDLCAFLTEDVVYCASATQRITGRTSVLGLIDDLRSTFDELRTTLLDVAVAGDVVLAEEVVLLGLPGASLQRIMSFSSFRMEGARISAWHQLHG